MSDVRVNLLPEDVRRKGAESRRNVGVVAAFGVLILVIGAVYFWQLQRVDSAQAVVDEEQAALQALQAERAELQEYEELRTLREEGDQVVRVAMGREASAAGVMQDIAAVMPSDAQLDSLTMSMTEPTPPDLGDVRERYGTISMTGRTRLGHAPGLERFLLEFDKIAAFSDLYFSDSSIDEIGAASFNVDVDLGPEILTGRYAAGLPEELR